MTKEQKIDKIVKDLPVKEMRDKMTDAEWHGWFLECWNEAINFTHCCTEFTCHSCNDKKSGKNDNQLHEVCKECFGSI